MFVLIEFQSIINRLRISIPNIKKPWNFLFDTEVRQNLYHIQESPRDTPQAFQLSCVVNFEIGDFSITKKSENALCQYVKNSVLSLYAIGVW